MIVNRNACVVVDGTGVPVAVFPGREGARRRATTWIREQVDRDDLRTVPLSKLRVQPTENAA